ncbi:MAG: hypothetical protein A3G73_05945 [Rhodospirillales bacterium RIFCSPLOWO2_12_FULL_67_15]|nr:MAG: hypothetical protein A3G73_05945 [Rhodospirillales bacterium RIFCSPLOWO2_12_FULL_67_15]
MTPPALAICGDIDLRIAADGTWYYHGSPIGRKELVRLFARVLPRGADGSFWLATPAEKTRIRVEDAPFLGVELAQQGAGTNQILRLRTNVDDWVVIGPDHPLRIACDPGGDGPKPYVAVRPGLDALIARPVYYELAGLAVKGPAAGGTAMGVRSAGAFSSLEQPAPRIAPDLNIPEHDLS